MLANPGEKKEFEEMESEEMVTASVKSSKRRCVQNLVSH